MKPIIQCPKCGSGDIDLCRYDSMIVVRPDLALFTLACPHCSSKITTMQPIPAALREEVRFAAIEVGAGMGHSY